MLCVGAGTGTVTSAIAPLVESVVGIDISETMLDLARRKPSSPNVSYMVMDARHLSFASGSFDRVAARMLFHHLVDGAKVAMRECYRVLKRGGTMLFSEGVPPDESVKARFVEIFRLKEKRLTFMPGDIMELLEGGGFVGVELKEHWIRGVSVRGWLEDSCVNDNHDRILQLHRGADDGFKRAYNMRVTGDDAVIDWKFVIATARKGTKP